MKNDSISTCLYVTFEDNRKTDGYTICRQCKYHLCRAEIPTMASANNSMYGVPPKYLKDLSHVEAVFISPVRSYGYVLTYMGRKQQQLKGVLSYYKVEMESIARSALHFEIVGMEKHIVTLLYGPMTAEQKSTVKQKSTIQPHHVLDCSQNYGFFCIYLHYIFITFAFCIAPRIDIFALHFINISKCQINVK